MKDIIEMLNRKRSQLESDYQFHLDWIQRMVNDPNDVKAITFEQNMIIHLTEMNTIKSRLREVNDQLMVLSLQ